MKSFTYPTQIQKSLVRDTIFDLELLEVILRFASYSKKSFLINCI